ncbi:phenylalanine--tRNA ligase subunit beta, partial [Candidatus Parcubacteria bacterium]
FVASIRLDAVGAGRPPRFAPLPEHPASQRDLVFLIDRGIESEAVVRAAARAAGSLAVQVRVFDRYSGQGIPEGKLSLGLRLVLQAPDRTLAQQEVDAVAERVVAEIGKRFGASLRA